jgi:hypothetical protein
MVMVGALGRRVCPAVGGVDMMLVV